VRGTHKLESVVGSKSQDMQTNRASETHSQTGEHRGRDELADQAKEEHLLPGEHSRGESSHEKKRQASEGHSLPGEHRGKDVSEHGTN
jgi:hypothetical protein